MDSLINKLAYSIKSYRKAKGISTHELAARLNISSGFINNVENARSDVFKLNLLMNLAKELDIPLNEVLFSEYVSLNDKNSAINEGKIELILEDEKIKNISCFYKYIPIIVDSLIDLIQRFENKDAAAQEICCQIVQDLDNLKRFTLLK
jgi:transcriptional regulator with XRE-family HTH domain